MIRRLQARRRNVRSQHGLSRDTRRRAPRARRRRTMAAQLGIRWTIGDVSAAGFAALRLSIHGALRLFGPEADYVVYVNTLTVAQARARTGPVPPGIVWRAAPRDAPDVLGRFLDPAMAEGVAWKFLPLRAFPDRHELALDNDVILWDLPAAIHEWLDGCDPTARVLAADIAPAHGQFAELCGPAPRNSGIRGTAPAFDLEAALGEVLRRRPVSLASELDEQGLQIAALSLDKPPLVVTVDEVSICSPFHPHCPELGCCGAHFVGLNARDIPWRYYDRPATEVRLAHWRGHRDELHRRVGLAA